MLALSSRVSSCRSSPAAAAAGSRRVALSAPFRHQLRRSVAARANGVTEITGEELEVTIAERTTPVIVDFFANWCGPCLILSQELEKVAAELGDKVKVVKLDVDKNPDLATMLKIEGLPTVVFIPKDASKPALRTEGLLPADRIVQIFNEHLAV